MLLGNVRHQQKQKYMDVFLAALRQEVEWQRLRMVYQFMDIPLEALLFGAGRETKFTAVFLKSHAVIYCDKPELILSSND